MSNRPDLLPSIEAAITAGHFIEWEIETVPGGFVYFRSRGGDGPKAIADVLAAIEASGYGRGAASWEPMMSEDRKQIDHPTDCYRAKQLVAKLPRLENGWVVIRTAPEGD
jgi:hypothetical protein